MGQIHWSEPALDDLKDIVSFVAKDSPTYRGLQTGCTREDGLVGGGHPLPSLALQACEGRRLQA